jgi:hypothetical protein
LPDALPGDSDAIGLDFVVRVCCQKLVDFKLLTSFQSGISCGIQNQQG